MHVARRIDSDQTVAVLARLAAVRGAPAHVRCDNGPELTAHALRDWCRYAGTETAFIEPGAPWQNAYVESFNAPTLRGRLYAALGPPVRGGRVRLVTGTTVPRTAGSRRSS